MKRCGRCGTWKRLEAFHRSKARGSQHWCKDCVREYDREWWVRNSERRRRQVKEHRRRLKEWHNAIKATTPCADCGRTFHPAAMTWDHLPGTDKVTEISHLIRAGKTLQAKNEILKCELVCANCHAVRSYERQTGRSSAW